MRWADGKVALIVGLFAVHGHLAASVRRFAADRLTRSSRYWRMMNEAPTLLMIGIVVGDHDRLVIAGPRSLDNREWLAYMTDRQSCTAFFISPTFDPSNLKILGLPVPGEPCSADAGIRPANLSPAFTS